MLRFALLVLLIANAGYLAWSQGWMATLGWTPLEQSEPHRLQQQVRPDVLRVVPVQEASPPPSLPAPAPNPVEPAPLAAPAQNAPITPESVAQAVTETTACLQSEALNEAQAQRLRAALQRSELPPGSWDMQANSVTGRWMVYLGKFANEMALEKRRAELRTRKIAYDRAGGQLEPGLSLGRFSTEESATRELSTLLNQGVRGARVVQERATQTLYTLRLPQATPAQQQMVQTLAPSVEGLRLRACSS